MPIDRRDPNRAILKVQASLRHLATIDDYYNDAQIIWKRDANERNPLDLWVNLSEHVLRVFSNLRRGNVKEGIAIDDVGDSFMWLMSLLSGLQHRKETVDSLSQLNCAPSLLLASMDRVILPIREYQSIRGFAGHHNLPSLELAAIQEGRPRVTVMSAAEDAVDALGEATECLKDVYTSEGIRMQPTASWYETPVAALEARLGRLLFMIIRMSAILCQRHERGVATYCSAILAPCSTPRLVPLSLADILWAKYGVSASGDQLSYLVCAGCHECPCQCTRDIRIAWVC